MKRSGIYKIEYVDGRSYVGSAVKIGARWAEHKRQLRRGVHHSVKLQRAWDKYGADQFSFSVIEYVEDKSALIAREQHWIDALCAAQIGFNIAAVAGSCLGVKQRPETNAARAAKLMGHPVSAATREKLRQAHTGKTVSQETRRKISEAQRGKAPPPLAIERARQYWQQNGHTAESRAKISNAKRGKPMPAHVQAAILAATVGRKQPAEEIARRAEKLRGKKRPADAIERTVAAKRGVPMSEDQKRKISATMTGRKLPREVVEKVAAALRGRPRPPHVIEAVRKAHLGRTFSPEHKAKLSLAQRARFARERAAREAQQDSL